MAEKIEKPKRLTTRELIFLVLGLAGGAGVAHWASDSLPNRESSVSAISSASKAVSDAGASKSLPGNLVRSDLFDKNPFDYVDVNQCRALVFKLDPRVISEGEVLGLARKIEEKKRKAEVEALIDGLRVTYCIYNPEDLAKVEASITEECDALDAAEPLRFVDGHWVVQLRGREKSCYVDLSEEPKCKSGRNSDQEKREKENLRLKEQFLARIGASGVEGAFSSEEIREAKKMLGKIGLENFELEGSLKMADQLLKAQDPKSRRKALCGLVSSGMGLMKYSGGERKTGDQAANDAFDAFYDKYMTFHQAVWEEAERVDPSLSDFKGEECLMVIQEK